MELKLSYKWIQEYVKTNLSAADFARKLSLHGPSIEKWDFDKNLNDNILDIEVTSNRVDSASVIGIAREASTILKADFLWELSSPNLTPKKNLPISIKIHNFERCSRFQSIVIDNVNVKESPEWMRMRLEAAGINSINNIVDITNYVLLEYGQPMHAYDYNKLDGHEINIRLARDNETIKTLGANEDTKLTDEDLVVADVSSPLSIAGVKGGEKSGITNKTTTIILEAANFDAVKTRKSARRHNLQTEASSLFEKDLPAELTQEAILRAIELVLELAGGEIASDLIDEKLELPSLNEINYNYDLTNKVLGLEIEKSEVIDILFRLGFECEDNLNFLKVKVPYYRAKDVKYDYDLTEEIARMYGYHKIPSILPATSIPEVKTPTLITNEDRVRDILADNGYTEMFSYSLVSEKYLQLANVKPENTIQLLNPLSTDFLYMRTEMGSTALMVSSNNQSYKEKLKFFEVSNIYTKKSDRELPTETSILVIVANDANYKKAFYEVKGIWEMVLNSFNINLLNIEYKNEDVGEPYQSGRSAYIFYKGDLLGKIGTASKNAKKIAGLKKENALLEVNFEKLSEIIDSTVKSYKGIPKYPAVTRDIALVIDKNIEWRLIENIVYKFGGSLVKSVELFDVFDDIKLGENKKSIAFHINLQSDEKTLEELEVNNLLQKIMHEIATEFHATIRE